MKNILISFSSIFQQKKKQEFKQEFKQLLDKNIKYYNKIYDILVSIGASKNMQDIFVNAHVSQDCQEWRFDCMFGTVKYLKQYNVISPNFICLEDKIKIDNINEQFKKLKHYYF